MQFRRQETDEEGRQKNEHLTIKPSDTLQTKVQLSKQQNKCPGVYHLCRYFFASFVFLFFCFFKTGEQEEFVQKEENL